jgi:hypothetical protein
MANTYHECRKSIINSMWKCGHDEYTLTRASQSSRFIPASHKETKINLLQSMRPLAADQRAHDNNFSHLARVGQLVWCVFTSAPVPCRRIGSPIKSAGRSQYQANSKNQRQANLERVDQDAGVEVVVGRADAARGRARCHRWTVRLLRVLECAVLQVQDESRPRTIAEKDLRHRPRCRRRQGTRTGSPVSQVRIQATTPEKMRLVRGKR